MSTAANKEFIQSYWNALSGKRKTRALIEQYVDNEELIQHIEMAEAAFPCYEVFADEVMAERDLVTVRARVSGTHGGEFMGIPPTNKTFSQSFLVMFRIRDSKIVEQWLGSDSLDLLQQLGVLPTNLTTMSREPSY